MTQIANTTRHDYTGQEHLDNVGLIHMNGRVFDPAIGRFMSADPFIDGVETVGSGMYKRAIASLFNRQGDAGSRHRQFVHTSRRALWMLLLGFTFLSFRCIWAGVMGESWNEAAGHAITSKTFFLTAAIFALLAVATALGLRLLKRWGDTQ